MKRFRHLQEHLAGTTTAPARLGALNALACALARAGNAEQAMPLAREAEQLAVACADDDALSVALCNVGMSQYLRAQYAEGFESCLRALECAERAENPEAVASALITGSACQYQMGAREDALQSLYQALELIDSTSCDHLLIRAHNALGIILGHKGRYHEAVSHYRSALEIGAIRDDQAYMRRVKINYASLHLDQGVMQERDGDQEAAGNSYRAGVRLCEDMLLSGEFDNPFDEASCLGMLGELYCLQGDVERGKPLFADMLELGAKLMNPHLQAEALLQLGKAHMRSRDFPAARDHFERAVGHAAGANVRRLIADGFLSLAAWFEASGDFQQALEYQKRFHALSDELLRAELHATGMAHEIWLKFQRTRRELRSHLERTETLVRDHGALSERASHLARMANEDALTGLSNRRHLDTGLAQLLATAHEQGSRVCVGIIDIDHFKSINDSHSHCVGDTVLRTVASMIGAHCREGDISARYGGDEFVICLVGATLDSSTSALERLRSLADTFPWQTIHAGLRVTLSIGVAELAFNDSVETLMRRVDAALYQAKREGRNCVIGDPGTRPDSLPAKVH